MIDRLFSAALVFTLLAGGTVAIGAEFVSSPSPAARVAQWPEVVVVGHRDRAPANTEVATAQPFVAATR